MVLIYNHCLKPIENTRAHHMVVTAHKGTTIEHCAVFWPSVQYLVSRYAARIWLSSSCWAEII